MKRKGTIAMPQLLCRIPKGLLTPDSKKKMLQEIVKVTHESVGSDPTIINIVVEEVERSDYVINGEVV
jgi:phenylpyruvate tautomerase PptA (4-oxalocrotonate tautomerase family)